MSYNKNNVWIEGREGFIRMTQTGFLNSQISPTFKILAEGDSWFNIGGSMGFARARNLTDEVNFNDHHTLLCNMAMSGDTMANMADQLSSTGLFHMLKNYDWDGLLLSGGGNDLIDALLKEGGYKRGNKKLSVLRKAPNATSFKDYIDQEHLDLFSEALLGHYQKIIDKKRTSRNADKPVFLHTYDYPVPRDSKARFLFFKGGPWISRAFKKMNIPEQHWEKVTVEIFNHLEFTLMTLDGSDHFHVVKTFGTLKPADPQSKGDSNDWDNEIHPNAKGIKKIADKINKKMKPFYLKNN